MPVVATASGAPTRPSTPARVLLADDDPAIRDLVATLLTAGGYTVTTCITPEQTASLLATQSFDLILADGLSQNSQTAWQTAAVILDAAGSTPAILFSAHRFDAGAVRALGYRDFVAKPFDIDDLEARLAHVVAQPGPPRS